MLRGLGYKGGELFRMSLARNLGCGMLYYHLGALKGLGFNSTFVLLKALKAVDPCPVA